MKKVVMVILFIMLTSTVCFAGPEEVQSLEKIFASVQLKKAPPLNMVYLPRSVDKEYVRYEGQVGKLTLAVFVRPKDKTVARVHISAPGILTDILPATISEFGQPSSSSAIPGFSKSYKGEGKGFYWEVTMMADKSWPATTSVFYANDDEKI